MNITTTGSGRFFTGPGFGLDTEMFQSRVVVRVSHWQVSLGLAQILKNIKKVILNILSKYL